MIGGDWWANGRIQVLAGHYGSGKTEIALNLALKLRALGREVALVDLDIVNPFFRSAERGALL
ncbi:MAG: MinD/ParA family protein, partial [Clostridiales bacterium]|nr:MinD/ParA family protein [Clostridiales bacterium]